MIRFVIVPYYLHGTTILGAPVQESSASASVASQWDTLYDRAAGDFEVVEKAVKKVRARISPWLWIFSIWGAFGTTVAVWSKMEQLRDRDWRFW